MCDLYFLFLNPLIYQVGLALNQKLLGIEITGLPNVGNMENNAMASKGCNVCK